MNKTFVCDTNGIRLDKYLALKLDASRNQIENLIKKDLVKVDGKTVSKTGFKLCDSQNIEIEFPDIKEPQEYSVDFDVEVIFEDDHILVINKPSGLTVHQAPSVNEATLVDWLKAKKISLSTISGEERHGIVHRLDKGTSGVMVVAKTNEAHAELSRQLEDKSMGRYYLAVIDLALKQNTIIEKNIGRKPKNRLMQAVVPQGRYAKSAFAKIALSNDEKKELIAAKLFTGRTHQIRVHLNSFNRHILGDGLYGFKGKLDSIDPNRFFLHAYSLYLIHPITKKSLNFAARLQNDMDEYICANFNKREIDEKIGNDHILDIFNDTDDWLRIKAD